MKDHIGNVSDLKIRTIVPESYEHYRYTYVSQLGSANMRSVTLNVPWHTILPLTKTDKYNMSTTIKFPEPATTSTIMHLFLDIGKQNNYCESDNPTTDFINNYVTTVSYTTTSTLSGNSSFSEQPITVNNIRNDVTITLKEHDFDDLGDASIPDNAYFILILDFVPIF